MQFLDLPYSELMRLTLISSPLAALTTSIFFDQLPDFNSIESLKNKQKPVENQCYLSGSLHTQGSDFRSTLPHVSFC